MKIFRNLIRFILFTIVFPSYSIAFIITALMEVLSDEPEWEVHKDFWLNPPSYLKSWSLK